MKRNRGTKRLVALMLLVVMISSTVFSGAATSMPDQGTKQSVQEVTQEQPAEKPTEEKPEDASPPSEDETDAAESPRQAMDWSGNQEELSLALKEAVYVGADEARTAVDVADGKLDLSGKAVADKDQIDLGFLFKQEKAPSESRILAGDTFSFAISSEGITIEDIGETAIYNGQGQGPAVNPDEKIASYEVKDQVVTVTFAEDAQGGEVFSAIIPITAKINMDQLSREKETAAEVLWGAEKTAVIVLPMLQDKEPAAEPTDPSEPGDSVEPSEPTDQEKPSESQDPDQKETEATQPTVGDKDLAGTDNKEDDKSFFEEVRSFFRNMFSNLVPKAAGDPLAGAKVSKHTFKKDVLPEGFEQVILRVYSKDGGYKKGESPLDVGFRFSITMNDLYLYEKSEAFMKYPNFPRQGSLSDEEYYVKIEKWINDNGADIPPLEYTFDMGETFAASNQGSDDITDGSGTSGNKIGSYKIEGRQLTVTVDLINYFKEAVYLDFSYTAGLDNKKLNDKPQVVAPDDNGKLVLEETGTAGSGDDPADKPKYTIEKEAPERVADRSFEYDIEIKGSEGNGLNGKYLGDLIPEGLIVESVSVGINGAAPKEIGAGEYELKSETVGSKNLQHLYYQFPSLSDDNSNLITEAQIKLKVILSDAEYKALVTTGSISKDFENTAELLDDDKSNVLGTSEEVSTQMTINFLKKTGKSANLEGSRYAWTVSLDTYLPYMEYGYLVDTLCWTDHTYDFKTGITVMKEGGEKKERAILVIPYQGLQGPYTAEDGTHKDESRGITVKYFTDLDMHGKTPAEYWEIVGKDANKPQIDNKVNLLWQNAGGPGVGPAAQDQVNIGKDVESDFGPLAKRAQSYDPKTRTLTWAIDVDKLGMPLENVVIEDVFAKGAYDLNKLNINYYLYEAGTGQKLLRSGPLQKLDSQPDYPLLQREDTGVEDIGYMLSDPDGEGKRTLSVYLGNMNQTAKPKFYTVTISLPLTDPKAFAEGSTTSKTKCSNKIKMMTGPSNKRVDTEAEGSADIPHTLIEKKAVGTYDYFKHELNWSVTANPEHINIKDATVTDNLEPGFKFATLTKVTKIDKEGNETDVTQSVGAPTKTDETNTDGKSYQKLVWNILDMGTDTYIFDFSVTATSDWRDKNLVATKAKPTIEVPNKAILAGNVVSEADSSVTESITNAEASAKHIIKTKPISKSGVYNEEQGSIDWTVVVNQSQYNIAGWKMVETLTRSDEVPVHELDVDSVKVVEDTKTGDGTSEVTGTVGSLDPVTSNGFTYTFKDIGNGKNEGTYKITFKTYLTKAAAEASIINKVYLNDEVDQNQEVSGESNGGYTGGFDFENNAGAKTRPKIGIHKVSENSVNTGSPGSSLPLEGAVFQLDAYTFNLSDTITASLNTKSPQYSKSGVPSDKEGDITFCNIKTQNQNKGELIYVLQETTPPGGYQADTEPRFVYFGDQQITNISYNAERYTEKSITKVTAREEDGKTVYDKATIPYTNEVAAGSLFEFTKQQVSSLTSDGIANQYENAVGVVFKVEMNKSKDKPEDKVNTRYITSDSDGKLKLDKLDPGTYTLTEVQSNTGMSVGGTVELVVTWKGSAFEYTLNDPKDGISIDPPNGTILNDDLTRGTFSFTKYAQYTGGEGSAIVNENREVLPGATFALKGKANIGTNGTEIKLDAVANNTGEVTFNNIPAGSYSIYEVKAPDGYEPITDVNGKLICNIVATEDYDKEIATDGNITYKSKKIKIAVKDKNDHEIELTEVNNTPIKGTISFTKKSSDTKLTTLSGKPLSDAKFGLHRKIGEQIATKPIYEATSDTNGKVEFKDVEFGDYVLKEISAPTGYQKTEDWSKGKEITKEQLTTGISSSDKTQFAYTFSESDQLTGIVTNQLIKKDITLTKTDPAGAPLSGVTFNFYRRGNSQVEANGRGFVLEPGEGVKTFEPYLPIGKTVKSNATGKIELKGLPCGDYLLVEQESGLPLQDGFTHKAVLICITAGSTDAEVKIYDTNAVVDVDNVITPSTEGTFDKTSWTAIEISSNLTANVVNKVKYGFININKYAAESGGTPVTNNTAKTPVTGAKFEITKKGTDSSYTHYLTLTTNENGQFKIGENDKYQDGDTKNYKLLTYGDYKIKETTVPKGFTADQQEKSFTISDTTTNHEGTVWINSESEPQYVKKEAQAPTDTHYYNTVIRNTITLKKTDKTTNVLLSGAGFTVYDGENPVASLTESATKGTYTLSDQNTMGKYQATKKVSGAEIPYLYKAADGIFRILPGQYTIKETTTPPGYITLPTRIDVTVLENNGTPTGVNVTNTPVQLTINKINRNNTSLTGAEFSLKGKFAEEPTKEKTISITGDSLTAGGLIVDNTYVLTETKAPDQYLQSTAQVKLEVQSDGTFTLKDGGKDAVLGSDKSTVQFTNYRDVLRIKKADDKGTPIKGAKLGLYKLDSQTNQPEAQPVETWTSDTEEKILTDDLVQGKYVLKEEQVPYGYLKAEDIYFNIAQDYTITLKAAPDGQQQGTLTGTTITMTDTKILGSIQLKKVYKGTTTPIPNVVFELCDLKQNEKVIAEQKTDSQGQLTFEAVPEGEYIVKENRQKSVTAGVSDDVYFNDSWKSSKLIINKDVHGKTVKVGETGIVENEKFSAQLELKKTGASEVEGLSGVEFLLEKQAGSSYTAAGNHKTDSSGMLRIAGLTMGKYRLTETKTIPGYILNTSKPFTCEFQLTNDNQGNTVTIKKNETRWAMTFPNGGELLTNTGLQNHASSLSFFKAGKYNESCSDEKLGGPSADETKPLEGAEFTLYKEEAPSVPTQTAVSDKDGKVEFQQVSIGKYLIKETNTLDGFKKNTETYKAEVTAEGFKGLESENGTPLKDNTVINDVYRTSIKFVKVQEKKPNEVLEGSVYGLYKAKTGAVASAKATSKKEQMDGMILVAKAVTDKDGLLEFDGVLMNTEYVIRELQAPDGSYVSANPFKITYKVDENGDIVIADVDTGNGTVVRDPETGEFKWLEPTVEVSIAKKDNKKKLLAGAKLEIQDKDGNVMAKWTSSEKAYLLRGALNHGETYKLVEKKAPKGYQIAKPVKFKVDGGTVGPNEDKIIEVVMIDMPITTSEDPGSNGGNNSGGGSHNGNTGSGGNSNHGKPGPGGSGNNGSPGSGGNVGNNGGDGNSGNAGDNSVINGSNAKTGDSNQWMIFAVLMLIALTACIVIVKTKKNNK